MEKLNNEIWQSYPIAKFQTTSTNIIDNIDIYPGEIIVPSESLR